MSDELFPDVLFDGDEEWESVCGEAYDHTEVVTYEDDEIVQWYCENCGAEGWDDK